MADTPQINTFTLEASKRIWRATKSVEQQIGGGGSQTKTGPATAAVGFWAKITDNDDGKHAWTRQHPKDDASFEDGDLTGTTSSKYAVEASGKTAPDGTIVFIRNYHDYYIFSLPSQIFAITIGSSVSAGSTIAVTLPNGDSVNATNWTQQTFTSGNKVTVYQDSLSGLWYLVSAKNTDSEPTEGGCCLWSSTAFDDIAAGDVGTVFLSDESEVEATNWSDDVDIVGNDKIHVYFDPYLEEYFIIKSGGGDGGPRWFKGTLGSTLLVTDTTVSVTTTGALDGGSHPGSVTAINEYRLSAPNDSMPCLIAEDYSSEGEEPTYLLVQVRHVARGIVVDVRMDGDDLKQDTKTISALDSGAGDDTNTIIEGGDCGA